jgi:hypothetical protein
MNNMSKKSVLLIGGLTHTKKEWKEWSSKYILRVGVEAMRLNVPADGDSRSLMEVQGTIS